MDSVTATAKLRRKARDVHESFHVAVTGGGIGDDRAIGISPTTRRIDQRRRICQHARHTANPLKTA